MSIPDVRIRKETFGFTLAFGTGEIGFYNHGAARQLLSGTTRLEVEPYRLDTLPVQPGFHLSAPLIVWFEITRSCNLSCKHCYIEAGKSRENELSTPEIFDALDQLKEAGVFALVLVGGECTRGISMKEQAGYRPVHNEPISFDEHGDLPFSIPFSEISPSQISLYLQLDTRVGKKTCRQACAHCFYINQPGAANRSIDLTEGRNIMNDLAALGYHVFPMISDSLAYNGQFLRLFGNTHNRDFRQEEDCKETKTMEHGDLWTSGAPLLDENWEEYLSEALAHGFGNVTITFHGVLDENLVLLPEHAYPIKGAFPGASCERVIERIHAFNSRLRNGFDGIEAARSAPSSVFRINLGVTIGKHNHTRAHLLRYVEYFSKFGVSVVRFNAFHDHGWKLPHLPLTKAEIAQWYRDLKWVHENIPLNFQVGVDEDFGTSGIEVMGFPKHVGRCRAGRQLFAIVPDKPEDIDRNRHLRKERIGSIAACVDAFKPIVGRLVRETRHDAAASRYYLEFFTDVIDALMQKRLNGTYVDGCFAAEMLDEFRQASVVRLEGLAVGAARNAPFPTLRIPQAKPARTDDLAP
jgi:MoaA/NifB/PqqE/SkfB family radical SAM enzyme